MILAIVGTTKLANHPDVTAHVRDVILKYRPDEVVTGGGDGVDSTVRRVALEMGIGVRVFKPEVQKWDGGDQVGYRQRNEQIAYLCDRLVRIAEPKPESASSAWTKELAEKLGRPTEEKIIDA